MDIFPGICRKKVEKSGPESWHLIAIIIKNSSSYIFFNYFEIFIDFFGGMILDIRDFEPSSIS